MIEKDSVYEYNATLKGSAKSLLERTKKSLKNTPWDNILWGALAAMAVFFLGKYLFHFLEDGLQYQLLGELNHHYASVIVWLIISYVFTFLIYFAFISRKLIFLGIYALVTIVMLCLGDIQSIALWLLLLFASIPCLLLIKLLNTKIWGRQAIGNLLLLGVIIFATWKIFVPDSDVTTLKNKSEIDVFGLYYRNFINIICFKYKTFRDSSMPFALGNPTAFVVSLGVFIYTAFLCSALKSWIRWILYIIAGIAVLVTGISYYQNFDPAVQIALFLLFVIVWCSFFSLIANSNKKKCPQISEGLGRKRAYDRLHAWIRRALHGEEGVAIGICGDWGTGKTHCLRYLSHRLSLKQPKSGENAWVRTKESFLGYDKRQYDDDINERNAFMGSVKICMVDLWDYESREAAWNAIVLALSRAILGRSSIFNSTTLNKYLPDVMRALPAGSIVGSLYNLFFQNDQNYDDGFAARLSDEISTKERVVLIFDDIERADYEIIKALPSLIDRLRGIKRLMVICAYAPKKLALKLERGENQKVTEEVALENQSGYETKICDVLFQLPDISPQKGRSFADETLKKEDRNGECALTRRFLGECNIGFATPRQIERIVGRLCAIERQFFYDADEEKLSDEEIISYKVVHHNVLHAYYSHTAFLVEIIKNFYPQLLRDALNNPDGPVRYARKVKHIVELIEKQEQRDEELKDEEKNELENFINNNTYMYDNIKSDHFYVDLINGLSQCRRENVQRAVEGEYRRRIVLTTHECEKLYTVLNKDPQMTLLDGFKKIFGGEESIPEDINASGLEFFNYVTERIFDEETDYAKMLLRLIPQGHFERDKGIKPVSSSEQVFTWPVDHFFYLLYFYSEKAPKDKPLAERFKNIVIQMFDRASILTKYSILHSFFHYQEDEPPQLKDEIEDRLDYKSISVRIVNENGVTEELFKCYVKRYIQGVLKSEISKNEICENYYGISKFLMLLVERKDYADILSAEFIANDIEGIRNSIDVLTLPCVCQDHSMEPKIMMSSERMVDLILPILRKGIDIYDVNAVTSTKIDDWIKNCNESIEYWSKVQTNKAPNYTVGAEKVKEFLEDLKAKRESNVEKEAGKTSK